MKEHFDSKFKYTADDIIKMLEFLVDNIFVVFALKVFQQTVCIPMGTNCAPLLVDIFLYSYEAEFIVFALNWKETASQFNLTHWYVDDVLSITTQNSKVIWARCILLTLRSMTPQRASLLLFTYINFCRLGD